jgi:hypothetical protein
MRRTDDDHFQDVDTLAEADGIMFVCPKCFKENDSKRPGVHSIICWSPSVPQTTGPVPGRWKMSGTGYDDLSLTAQSSSVLLTSGCRAHFFINNGEIELTP